MYRVACVTRLSERDEWVETVAEVEPACGKGPITSRGVTSLLWRRSMRRKGGGNYRRLSEMPSRKRIQTVFRRVDYSTRVIYCLEWADEVEAHRTGRLYIRPSVGGLFRWRPIIEPWTQTLLARPDRAVVGCRAKIMTRSPPRREIGNAADRRRTIVGSELSAPGRAMLFFFRVSAAPGQCSGRARRYAAGDGIG